MVSDLSLSVGGLEIGLLGIGITSPIKDPAPEFTIQGLAVSFGQGPVSIMGGMLGTGAHPLQPPDFTGVLSVQAPELSLSALAAYTEDDEQYPSFFLYGVLDSAIGGTPFVLRHRPRRRPGLQPQAAGPGCVGGLDVPARAVGARDGRAVDGPVPAGPRSGERCAGPARPVGCGRPERRRLLVRGRSEVHQLRDHRLVRAADCEPRRRRRDHPAGAIHPDAATRRSGTGGQGAARARGVVLGRPRVARDRRPAHQRQLRVLAQAPGSPGDSRSTCGSPASTRARRF